MKISELIKQLEEIKIKSGDLEVQSGYDITGAPIWDVHVGPKTIVDQDGFDDASDEDYCWIMA